MSDLDDILGQLEKGGEVNGMRLGENGGIVGKCSKCAQSVEEDEASVVTGNRRFYHQGCYKCVQCGGELAGKTSFQTHTGESPVCETCHRADLPNCGNCQKRIHDPKIMILRDKKYHRECLKCHYCNEAGFDQVFSVPESDGDIVSCKGCFTTKHVPYCAQCGDPICELEGAGLLRTPYLEVGQHKFHHDCFRCAKCEEQFKSKKAYQFKDKYYCLHDYREVASAS